MCILLFMKRELFHIWGPLSINSFGTFIVIGVLIFNWLIRKHPKFKHMKLGNVFAGIMVCATVAGLVGGRALSVLTSSDTMYTIADFCAPWNPGFSILGGIIGILTVIPWYLRYLKIPILPFLDLAVIHVPLLQAISRVGCFFAGCCYGQETRLPWGVIYRDPLSAAPLYTQIHPTQIYSSLLLLLIFALMYFVLQHRFHKPGQLTALYLILTSIERFIVDFFTQ